MSEVQVRELWEMLAAFLTVFLLVGVPLLIITYPYKEHDE